MLTVNGVTKKYKKFTANDNLTFTITNDELVATAQDSGVSVRLSDGKVIAEPAEGVDVATSTFWLPMGVYYVRDFEKRNRTDNVSIVAYDGMKLIEEHVDNYSPEHLNTGKTAKQLITRIGNEIGVSTIVSDSLPNAAEHIPITGYYSKKWIDMLGYLINEAEENAPYFKLDPVYRLKNLVTYMGSYTELKHDTLLYVKQNYAEM